MSSLTTSFAVSYSILLLTMASGCFPYNETYRPAAEGQVVDSEGQPLGGVTVRACSASKWIGLQGGCPREVTATTDVHGRFAFETHQEREWCCLGEAPLPFTVIAACGSEGRRGGAKVVGPVSNMSISIAAGEEVPIEEVATDRAWWGPHGGELASEIERLCH